MRFQCADRTQFGTSGWGRRRRLRANVVYGTVRLIVLALALSGCLAGKLGSNTRPAAMTMLSELPSDPEKRNAINCESMCRLYDAWVQLDQDDDIKWIANEGMRVSRIVETQNDIA